LADAGSKPLSSAKVKPIRRMTATPLCEKDHIAADVVTEAKSPVMTLWDGLQQIALQGTAKQNLAPPRYDTRATSSGARFIPAASAHNVAVNCRN
jgi:hypothetical protein